MKKYFAKDLLIPKRIIQEGDLIEHSTTHNRMIATKDMGLGFLTINTEWQAVKLFLCSRDIQVGDIVQTEGIEEREVKFIAKDGTLFFTNGDDCNPEFCFKVIGEISLEATWVKEGDEFDEDDWRITATVFGDYVELEKSALNDTNLDRSGLKIEIKGPCGHFH